MQFFDYCVWFGGLVFVSTLRSVVHDLKAVLMPNLFPILLNFYFRATLGVKEVLCNRQNFRLLFFYVLEKISLSLSLPHSK